MYFPTTQWTLLAHASLSGETSARQALEELCKKYWTPLFQFIRSRGFGETEAQDLTQEFLIHLVEHSTLHKADRLRGRFRSFLCGALIRFLSDERDRRLAQKRGGAAEHLSVERENPLLAAPDATSIVFDREWALAILENALATVRQEAESRDGKQQFVVLRQFLPGSLRTPTYEDAAARLGLTMPALKSELHRMRARFRAAVRQEVAATVSAPHEIDEEMNHLQEVLMDKGNDLELEGKPEMVKPQQFGAVIERAE